MRGSHGQFGDRYVRDGRLRAPGHGSVTSIFTVE